jgi:hypothetical protein
VHDLDSVGEFENSIGPKAPASSRTDVSKPKSEDGRANSHEDDDDDDSSFDFGSFLIAFSTRSAHDFNLATCRSQRISWRTLNRAMDATKTRKSKANARPPSPSRKRHLSAAQL